MKRSDFAIGDRLLVQTYYSSTHPIEITVLEIAQKAVKVRHASGGETWEIFRISLYESTTSTLDVTRAIAKWRNQ